MSATPTPTSRGPSKSQKSLCWPWRAEDRERNALKGVALVEGTGRVELPSLAELLAMYAADEAEGHYNPRKMVGIDDSQRATAGYSLRSGRTAALEVSLTDYEFNHYPKSIPGRLVHVVLTDVEHRYYCHVLRMVKDVLSGKVQVPNSDRVAREAQPACQVCGEQGSDAALLACRACNVTVHADCVDVSTEDCVQWLCDCCKAGNSTAVTACDICHKSGGFFFKCFRRSTVSVLRWAHLICGQTLPGQEVAVDVHQRHMIIKKISQRARLSCGICSKGKVEGVPPKDCTGGCVQCHRCLAAFHPSCAMKARLILVSEARDGYRYRVTCPQHHPDPSRRPMPGLYDLVSRNNGREISDACEESAMEESEAFFKKLLKPSAQSQLELIYPTWSSRRSARREKSKQVAGSLSDLPMESIKGFPELTLVPFVAEAYGEIDHHHLTQLVLREGELKKQRLQHKSRKRSRSDVDEPAVSSVGDEIEVAADAPAPTAEGKSWCILQSSYLSLIPTLQRRLCHMVEGAYPFPRSDCPQLLEEDLRLTQKACSVDAITLAFAAQMQSAVDTLTAATDALFEREKLQNRLVNLDLMLLDEHLFEEV